MSGGCAASQSTIFRPSPFAPICLPSCGSCSRTQSTAPAMPRMRSICMITGGERGLRFSAAASSSATAFVVSSSAINRSPRRIAASNSGLIRSFCALLSFWKKSRSASSASRSIKVFGKLFISSLRESTAGEQAIQMLRRRHRLEYAVTLLRVVAALGRLRAFDQQPFTLGAVQFAAAPRRAAHEQRGDARHERRGVRGAAAGQIAAPPGADDAFARRADGDVRAVGAERRTPSLLVYRTDRDHFGQRRRVEFLFEAAIAYRGDQHAPVTRRITNDARVRTRIVMIQVGLRRPETHVDHFRAQIDTDFQTGVDVRERADARAFALMREDRRGQYADRQNQTAPRDAAWDAPALRPDNACDMAAVVDLVRRVEIQSATIADQRYLIIGRAHPQIDCVVAREQPALKLRVTGRDARVHYSY